MSRIVDQFDPSTETSTTFNAGFSNGTGRIVVYNQSPNNLNISWDAFSTYCPAWTAMLYCITSSSVNLNWAIQTTLTNASPPPISQVTIEAFSASEAIMGTYPASLMHQTSIGNSVSTTVNTTIGNLQNDNNVSGTNIVESTVIGSPSSTVSIDNNGGFLIGQYLGGIFKTLLKTAQNTGVLVASLFIPDTTGVAREVLYVDNNNDTDVQAANLGKNVNLKDEDGTTIAQFSKANGLNEQVGHINLSDNTKTYQIAGMDVISSPGTGPINIIAPNVGGGHTIDFYVGSTIVAQIGSTGNMILLGTLTQNGTP